MRALIFLTTALACFSGSLRAQLAQPPTGVTEGVLKEPTNACPANPDLANLDVYLEIGSSVDHDGLEVQALGDYRKWWLEQLEKRHAYRPIAPDRRLFTPG